MEADGAVKVREYFAKPDCGLTDDDAKVIGGEIQRLYEQGASTTKDIVWAASDKSSPLHRFLEWDNAKAGDEWRRFQVRQLIQKIVVKVRVVDQVEDVRAFHAIKINASNPESDLLDGKPSSPGWIKPPSTFVPLDVVKKVPDYREQVIEEARQKLISWRTKYRQYQEILGKPFQQVFAAIDQLEEAEQEAA